MQISANPPVTSKHSSTFAGLNSYTLLCTSCQIKRYRNSNRQFPFVHSRWITCINITGGQAVFQCNQKNDNNAAEWKLKKGKAWYGARLVLRGYWLTGRSFLDKFQPRLKITGLILDKHVIRINLKSKYAFRAAMHPRLTSRAGPGKNSLQHLPLWHSRPTRGKSCNIYTKATWFPQSDRPIHILLITSPGVSGRRAGWGFHQRDRAQNTAMMCCSETLAKLQDPQQRAAWV